MYISKLLLAAKSERLKLFYLTHDSLTLIYTQLSTAADSYRNDMSYLRQLSIIMTTKLISIISGEDGV